MNPRPSLLLAVTLCAGASALHAQTAASVETPQGREEWDSAGLAFKTNKKQGVVYDRELQAIQRRMNQNPPPGAPAIPETGRYNLEMFQHTHLRLKGEAAEHAKGVRLDRMIWLAELLDLRYRSDAWLQDKAIEADLIRHAKLKPGGVYDIVEGRLAQRKEYLEKAEAAVQRYETDMNALKSGSAITENQAGAMALSETNARRWLALVSLEAQAFTGKNVRESLDASTEQGRIFVEAIDRADLPRDQKDLYKEKQGRLRARSSELLRVLEATRKSLESGGSTDEAGAMLSSSKDELRDVSAQYRQMWETVAAKIPR